MTSQRIQGFLEGLFKFFQYKWGIKWWARKRIHYSCEVGIEKSVPRDHRLSSLGKPRDANRWSSGRIFLSHPHTHDRFLYTMLEICMVCKIWSIGGWVNVLSHVWMGGMSMSDGTYCLSVNGRVFAQESTTRMIVWFQGGLNGLINILLSMFPYTSIRANNIVLRGGDEWSKQEYFYYSLN